MYLLCVSSRIKQCHNSFCHYPNVLIYLTRFFWYISELNEMSVTTSMYVWNSTKTTCPPPHCILQKYTRVKKLLVWVEWFMKFSINHVAIITYLKIIQWKISFSWIVDFRTMNMNINPNRYIHRFRSKTTKDLRHKRCSKFQNNRFEFLHLLLSFPFILKIQKIET